MIKTARSFKSISLSLLSSVLLFTSAATPALAEYWSPSGNNIYKNNFGNVGIGISSPLTPLHVNIDSSTYGAIRVSEGATTAIDFGDATGVGVNGIAALFSNGTEKIRLFADPTQNSWINAGNLGIGTDAPDSKLTVSGTTKLTGNPVSTPILTVDSNADGKYSAIVKGPNPGLAIQNINDPATSGLYKLVSSGNALMLSQNNAAAGDFSSQSYIMTWKNSGKVGINTTNPAYNFDVVGSGKISGQVGIGGSNPGEVIGGATTGFAVTGYTGLGGLRVSGADPVTTIYQPIGNLGIKTAVGSGVDIGDTTSGTALYVKYGKVGIGTTSMTDPLHISRSGAAVRNRLRLEVTGNTTDQDALITFTDVGENKSWSLGADDSSDVFTISNSAELGTTTRMLIDANGNVGIGTVTTPSEKLEVVGNIKATGIRGSNAVWAKVFNNTDSLLTSGTWTMLYFNSEYADPFNFHNTGVLEKHKLTLTSQPGVYHVACNVTFGPNATGVRGVQIRGYLGVVVAETVVPAAGNGLVTSISATADVLVPGDGGGELLCYAMSNGANVNVYYAAGHSPYFSATRIP